MSEESNVVSMIPRLSVKFKPKNVKVYEKEHGSILENISMDINNITELIRVGNGMCTEEVADDMLETFFDNGGDILEAIVQIVEALQNQGFIPRDIALGKVLKKSISLKLKKLAISLEEEMMEEEESQTEE